ncbi:MAG: nucleotidyltransferase domain-containing protein [Cyclobacteriaceae bacterium]
MGLDKDAIHKIQNYFKDQPVHKAYLFGSYAQDRADDLSDIDILVDLDYQRGIGLSFIQMQIDLQELLQSKVDLISSKALSKHIEPFVAKEKLLIYER